MKVPTFILAGKVGAGKTTAAEYLCKKYGFRQFSYVDLFMKGILAQRGLPVTRENLQDLGEEILERYGSEFFARMILLYIPDDVPAVIDNVRSLDAYAAICNMQGHEVFLVFITADDEYRLIRLRERDGLDDVEEMVRIDSRKTESKIESMSRIADYHILNLYGKEDLYAQLDRIMADVSRKCKKRVVE